VIRAVVDSSVLASAFIGNPDARPGRLVTARREHHFVLIACPELLAELGDVLARPKFARWSTDGRADVDRRMTQATATQKPGGRRCCLALGIVNQTVHAIKHIGWVPDQTGGYRGQMAVYVKPNGLLGTGYMAAIRPFRHLILYPPMTRQIGRDWRARMPEPRLIRLSAELRQTGPPNGPPIGPGADRAVSRRCPRQVRSPTRLGADAVSVPKLFPIRHRSSPPIK